MIVNPDPCSLSLPELFLAPPPTVRLFGSTHFQKAKRGDTATIFAIIFLKGVEEALTTFRNSFFKEKEGTRTVFRNTFCKGKRGDIDTIKGND